LNQPISLLLRSDPFPNPKTVSKTISAFQDTSQMALIWKVDEVSFDKISPLSLASRLSTVNIYAENSA
jgi:hypothetical protein